MTDLLKKWLVHYDPIHRGWTPRGIANGVCATRGFAFPRVAGGYNLYRGVGGGLADRSIPVGAAGAMLRTVATFTWLPHAAETEYSFAIASVGGGGVESGLHYLERPVAFDGNGAPEALRPNAVSSAVARAIDGGRFLISWGYDAAGQEAAVAEFRVFADAGDGVVDYEAPIGVVEFRGRAGLYSFVTGAFPHDSAPVFAVRAVAGDGVFDDSAETISARAVASGPLPHPSVLVEIVEA